VFQSTVPVTVHTVVSGWGWLKATVMAGVSEEAGEMCGDQPVSIMAQLLRKRGGGDETGQRSQIAPSPSVATRWMQFTTTPIRAQHAISLHVQVHSAVTVCNNIRPAL
jgi:hypothetical protein